MRIQMPSTILLLLLSVTPSKAAELKQSTVLAWDDYLRSVNTSVAKTNSGDRPFLWVDESPEAQRLVQSGELVITNRDPPKIPQGLIHHWVGVMFIPNVSD